MANDPIQMRFVTSQNQRDNDPKNISTTIIMPNIHIPMPNRLANIRSSSGCRYELKT